MEIARCLVSLAPIRKEPKHESEQVSQLLLGEWVKILEKGMDWMRIETEHQYTGWVRSRQFRSTQSKVALKECSTGLYRLNALDFMETSADDQARWCYGALLTGREFLALDMPASAQIQPLNPMPLSGSQLANLAMKFKGIPYLWGGRSVAGIDCSGLVQLVFNHMGYTFPRDAWQQALQGEDVEPSQEQMGDLMFFARKDRPVHHVAIYLNNKQYLHASEWVRIQSMDPTDSRYDEDRHQTWTGTKRISSEKLSTLAASYRRLFLAEGDR